jgi:hypothetical protein
MKSTATKMLPVCCWRAQHTWLRREPEALAIYHLAAQLRVRQLLGGEVPAEHGTVSMTAS